MDEMGNTESNYFGLGESADQIKARQEEKSEVLKSLELIDQIIERLEARITFYDTNKSIEVDVSTKPEEHLRAVLLAKGMSENLAQEKEWIQALRDNHVR